MRKSPNVHDRSREGWEARGLGLVGVLGAPLAGGIEVFQAEADGIDLAVAARALRLLLVGEHALAHVEQLAVETRELWHVRRRGRGRVVQQLAQDPRAAL